MCINFFGPSYYGYTDEKSNTHIPPPPGSGPAAADGCEHPAALALPVLGLALALALPVLGLILASVTVAFASTPA